jgi:UDP-2,3-diacylglucosamine hydrolase
MTRHQVQYLIHGHTHRPAIHPLEVNGQPAERLVLGAWHHEGSMIRVSEDETTLISFPF